MPASMVAGTLLTRMIGTPGAPSTTCLTTEANFAASPPSSVTAIASTRSFWPTRSISEVLTASIFFAAASPASEALIATAKRLGLKNFFSWRNRQISPPTFTALSPTPKVMSRIGGAADSPRIFLASSDASGQVSRLACFAASFMAKARQVGWPHFLQFVFGRYLNISTPESAMVELLSGKPLKNWKLKIGNYYTVSGRQIILQFSLFTFQFTIPAIFSGT